MLYHNKIVNKHYFQLDGHASKKQKNNTMADTFATLSRSVSLRSYCSGSYSAEESCTGTNAYWEAILLRKAAQAPMLTGKLFC